ncbi:MAG: hypothetical protein IJB49_08600 [Clostridia bacterium]|nr:hypothetical protein [Clostridia bacterium]
MNKTPLFSLLCYLPRRISRAICALPESLCGDANEIRLRLNAPASLTVGARNVLFGENGAVSKPSGALCATEAEINECLSLLTAGSLYRFDEAVASGFIPLGSKGRAGICGEARIENGKMNGFSKITSVALRVGRFIPELAMPLIEKYKENGLSGALVCSPPALGKTTFLKSAAFLLSSGKGISPKRVGIADERGELSALSGARGLCDILSGAPKCEAISVLTRTMAPEIIVCDEISPNETEPLLEAQSTGVCLIASAHCGSPSELLKRGRMKMLLESGIFPLCVRLYYQNGYQFEISETEAFL